MLIDMHIHTEEYSADSQLPLRKVMSLAKEMGLSGVCITDHGTSALRPKAEALSAEWGLFVIVGMEYTCNEGDLLVFGAPDFKPARMPLARALKEIKSCGGSAIAAHPFRWDTPNMGAAIEKCAEDLDGVEAFNGGATMEENLTAYHFAVEKELPMFGGSDAHGAIRLGRFATEFTVSLKDETEFIRTIQKARTMKKGVEAVLPVARKGDAYASAYPNEKRLRDRLSPPPVTSIKDILGTPRKRPSV